MEKHVYINNSELIKLRKQNTDLKEENRNLRNQIRDNLKAWEEMSRILHHKQDVIEEIEVLRVLANDFLLANKMAPIEDLNIPSKLRSILRSSNVSFISDTSYFIGHNIKRFRSIGKKGRDTLNLALIEYHK